MENRDSESALPPDLPANPERSYRPAKAPAPTQPEHPTGATRSIRDLVQGLASEKPADAAPIQPTRGESTAREFPLAALIARGGMGEVWQATQVSLARRIAVKTVRRDKLNEAAQEGLDGQMLSDFVLEAITTARLEHPNIVPVYDLGCDAAGAPQLAMKLVEGIPWDRSLAVDFEKLHPEDYLGRHIPILVAMAQAVAYAHSRGIIHRDLKPSQVMVGSFGEVLLMDWGLAISRPGAPTPAQQSDPILGRLPSPATASNPAGTPAFMAPEQTLRDASTLGPWTDVFLLGATLYVVLTGTPPHRALTSRESFFLAAECQIAPPTERRTDRAVPQELSDLAMRAMARRPSDRIASVRDFVAALQDYLSGANRRRQSLEYTARARAALAEAESHYDRLTDCAALLDRAAELWPQNDAIAPLRRHTIQRHARTALHNGDLVLARLLGTRLADEPERRSLLAEVDAREAAVKRSARIRRYLIAATLILAFLHGVGLLMLRESNLRTEREALRAQHSERVASLFQRMALLQEREAQLAKRLAVDVPEPIVLVRQLFAAVPPLSETTETRARGLLAEREALRAERASLDEDFPGQLPPPPFALELAEANLALYRTLSRIGRPLFDRDVLPTLVPTGEAPSEEQVAEVERLYQVASLAVPAEPAPLQGLAIAAILRGDLARAGEHADAALEAISARFGERSAEYAQALQLRGEIAGAVSDGGGGSRIYYSRALEVFQRRFHADARALHELYGGLGRWERAVEITTFTLSMALDLYPPDAPELAPDISYLGVALLGAGRSREALPYLERSLALDRIHFGPTHVRTLTSLLNIAALYRSLGRFGEALSFTGEAIDAAALADPPNPVLRYRAREDNVETLFNLGRVEEALRQAETLYAENADRTGTEEPTRGMAAYSLATIHLRLGDTQKAYPYMLESYEDIARRYGPDHPDTLMTLAAVATCTYSHQTAESALKLLADALERTDPNPTEIRQQSVRSALLTSKADCLTELGQFADAIVALDEAERLIRKRPANSSRDYDLAGVLSNRAHISGRLGRWPQMAEDSRAMRDILESLFGAEHTDVVRSTRILAAAYTFSGQLTDGLREARRALTLTNRLFPAPHVESYEALITLSRAQRAAGQFDEALQTALRARQTLDSIANKGEPHDEAEVTEVLSLAYTFAGQPEEGWALLRPAIEAELSTEGVDDVLNGGFDVAFTKVFYKAGLTQELSRILQRRLRSAPTLGRLNQVRAQLPLAPDALERLPDAERIVASLARVAEVDFYQRDSRDVGILSAPVGWSVITCYEILARRALSRTPARPEVARRLVLRSALHVQLTDLPTTSTFHVEFLTPMTAQLGLAEEMESIRATPPLSLYEQSGPAIAKVLDARYPALDWEAAYPEIDDWNVTNTLRVLPEVPDAEIEAILRRPTLRESSGAGGQ